MRAKLTDTFLQKRKAPETGREEIFDTQVQGFGIRIGQRERAFFYIRRVKGGKMRFSLGQYPAITLARARAEALDILNQIKIGQDPRQSIKQRKQIITDDTDNIFGKLAARFLNEYATGKKRPLRPQTVKGYKWALTGEPTLAWTKRALASIIDSDIIKVIDAFEAKKQFASARLLRAYLHRFFRWAVEKRLIDKNPASNIPLASAPSDFKRERVLNTTELRKVLEVANKLEDPARTFVNMLVLTGQRRGETALMKWADLDLDGNVPKWSIPAENAKNRLAHDVALPAQAMKSLRAMSRLGDYVFTTDGKTPMSGFSKIKAKLDAGLADSGLAHWTFHDLRRSAATGMADLGIPPHVIESILNHVSGVKAGVAGVYNRSRYDDERGSALATWARHVTICGPKVDPADTIRTKVP